MNNNDTFIIKINLDDLLLNQNNLNISNISNLLNISEESTFNDNDILFINKKQYFDLIMNNSGNVLLKTKINYDCSICCSKLKYSHKLYKINKCSHVFHFKCIKTFFKSISNTFKSIHQCPLCRSSCETITI